jgi:proteasome lid subunit RPN8/RPN11
MNVHIPSYILRRAVQHAQLEPTKEAVGFFAINPGKINFDSRSQHYVEYCDMLNIHPRPHSGSEVSAEAMADLIINKGMMPIAIFHSHPSGTQVASAHDFEFFPKMYVDWGFVWNWKNPLTLTQYKYTGEMRVDQTIEGGIFLEVQS